MSEMPLLPSTPAVSKTTRFWHVLAWLQRREAVVLLAAVALQLLVLAGMIAPRATTLALGETVHLRVIPVDPRDLFRGDYVTLSYDFSSSWRRDIEGLPNRNYGRGSVAGTTVYVVLDREADGVHWSTTKTTIYQPTSGVYLRGTLTDNGQITCGIESFYVPEGQGKRYEEAVHQRRLSAEVAVDSSGSAVLRNLRIE